MSLSSSLFSSYNGTSSRGNPSRKMRSFSDLYEVSNLIDDNITLYYHFNTCDYIVHEEAITNEKWRITMDEGIAPTKKNDT